MSCSHCCVSAARLERELDGIGSADVLCVGSVEAGAGGPAILIAKLEQLEAALSDARARERKLEAENRALIDSTR